MFNHMPQLLLTPKNKQLWQSTFVKYAGMSTTPL